MKTFNNKINPWTRYFARLFDILLFEAIIYLLQVIFFPTKNFDDRGLMFLALLLWLFVEAQLLSSWGFTPGKKLFNIKIRSLNNEKLTFSSSLKRSFLVWTIGLGLGIFSFITMIISYSELKKKGITLWDKYSDSIVILEEDCTIKRVIGFLSLIIIFVLLLSQMIPNYDFENNQSDNYIKTARELTSNGKFEEAFNLYKTVMDNEPGNSIALGNAGHVLIKMGKYQEGLDYCNKALELDPNTAEFYNNKGLALYFLEKNAAALENINKAISLKPDLAVAYCTKGNLLNIYEKYEEALENFEKAYNLDPNIPDAYSGKGVALRELGRYEEAVSFFDKSIELNKQLYQTFFEKAVLMVKTENYKEALTLIDEAIKINPAEKVLYNLKERIEYQLSTVE